MKKENKTNWNKIVFWISFIGLICLIPSFLKFNKEQNEMINLMNGYEGEHLNSCGDDLSCLCRDKCQEIYGHSDWNSWVYNRQGECWCVEKNETRRLF